MTGRRGTRRRRRQRVQRWLARAHREAQTPPVKPPNREAPPAPTALDVSARIREALLDDAASGNQAIAHNLDVPAPRVAEIRRQLLRAHKIHRYRQRGRTHSAECWCCNPETASDPDAAPVAVPAEDAVRAALLEDPERSDSIVANLVSLTGRSSAARRQFVGQIRAELEATEEIHRYGYHRGSRRVYHLPGCWCHPQSATPWALITWAENSFTTTATYFPTREAAEAAAPTDQTFSIVDWTRPADPRPNMNEILAAGRGVMRFPYPNSGRPRR